MYPNTRANQYPERAAFIMASTGETVTYAAFDARANRLAHLLRSAGLQHQDHYAIMMENNERYMEACAAGERAGLYYTCVNSYLTADELAYILTNSESQILITSVAKLDVVQEAVAQCSAVKQVLVVGAAGMELPEGFQDYASACSSFPELPIADELLGTSMLYSSGTTGRPKGIIRPLPAQPPAEQLPMFDFLGGLWRYREGMIYLSPAPLYHSAPQAAVNLTIRHGGTVIIMERFDPQEYLALIERYQVTHSQLVPTMFSRMLKLPEPQRQAHDLSLSLIHI